ncbi:MAG: thiamine-phosphate kinase [Desulfuromonadales bacterium]|nr:thiamine-phosphate kinase [Desulfuromonadales bacterium]
MNLSELGEFGLIERIRQRIKAPAGVVRGIGDDAAELTLPDGHTLLTSTDLLIEQIHFRFDWTDPYRLGRKAVAVNLSDLAAMGATPRYLYLGLACPTGSELDRLDAFLDGVLDETAAYGVTLVGGDTCRSPGPWMISVVVEGSAPAGESLGRAGARPGDLLLVSGTLGDSALALSLLQRDLAVDEALLEQHLTPRAKVALGQALAASGQVTAMIDVSDGLTADIRHLLRASRVGAELEMTAIPLSAEFRRHCARNPRTIDLALSGGEDYQLLFTAGADAEGRILEIAARCGETVSRIGRITRGDGSLLLRDRQGEWLPLTGQGFDHFAAASEPSREVVA